MWYEDTTQYTIEDGLAERSWPASLGLVHVYKRDDGDIATTSGWGRENFMENYLDGKFTPKGYLKRFQAGRAFGIIMRTVPYICVDIDGKNGGIQASRILMLPPTLAERSKSGNGFHLFYRLPEAEWSDQYGYDEYPDALGIIPGVDIKATGIVYHYPTQRWNDRPIATLPGTLRRLMDAHRTSREHRINQTAQILTGIDAEIQGAELIDELERKQLDTGGRNTWLFAWGCRAARYVDDWQMRLATKGLEAGLPPSECANIVQGVIKYGGGSEDSGNTV